MLGIPLRQVIISLLWASFISAAITSVLIFAWVDPSLLLERLGLGEHSRLHGYSMTFFFFWLVGIVNALLALFFLRPVPHRSG